jgi:hypothetical protein
MVLFTGALIPVAVGFGFIMMLFIIPIAVITPVVIKMVRSAGYKINSQEEEYTGN